MTRGTPKASSLYKHGQEEKRRGDRHEEKKNEEYKNAKYFWLFIVPWVIGFLAFTLIPMVYSFVISFTNWNGHSAIEFKGITNYINIFTKDKTFWLALKNTFVYIIVSVPLNTAFSILLAVLLNRDLPGSKVFRGIFYLPTICTGVAMYITWTYLFNGTNGYFNVLLNRIGLEGTNWLGNTSTAMGSIIFMEMFNIGTAMTIVLAGLQDVPRDFYEAANLDGATAVQKFFKITFPMISPVVFFNVLMAIIKGLQIFTQPYVMTQGGPAQSTYVYGLYLYNTAFSYGKFGYASSLAWVLFVIIIIITMVIMKTSNAWVFYREDVK